MQEHSNEHLTQEERDIMESVLSSNDLSTKAIAKSYAEECLPDRYKLIEITTERADVERMGKLNPHVPFVVFFFEFYRKGDLHHVLYLVCTSRKWFNAPANGTAASEENDAEMA